MSRVLEYVKNQLCEENGHTLLYLCQFGSQLYGTYTSESDVDYKGIFLPNRHNMLLDKSIKSINYHSGDNSQKNNKEDIDVDLWSIQYFFELIGKGETNAIDLIYSITNVNCIVFYDIRMKEVFDNPLNFFNPKSCDAFVNYAIGQAKKFGIKGSRLGVLKEIYEYLERDVVDDETLLENRLSVIKDDILENFYDESYCFEKEINGEQGLVICGKVHLLSIRLKEFYSRIKREYDKYGTRAKDAEENKGVDWKALSHAVRALDQMEDLLTMGKIEYPLQSANKLLDIKKGKYNFNEVEDMIREGLNKVESLQLCNFITGEMDKSLMNKIILQLYFEIL